MGVTKRYPELPAPLPRGLYGEISKADLLEVAYDLAACSNDSGSADDHESTVRKLVEMLNTRREGRGSRKLVKR